MTPDASESDPGPGLGVATPRMGIPERVCALPECSTSFVPKVRGGKVQAYCRPAHRFRHWDQLHPRQRGLPLEPAVELVQRLGPTPEDIRRAQKPATVLCLRMLQAGPCETGDFIRAGIGRFAARLFELRKVGHRITTKKLTDHAARYTLED